ncbi:winged helix DNA-binding domain-containing protein [Protaetiibacter intestinalis]|uniref:Winged helix DNA-binding domain-containing protein n=1 Tax=Protaetiibacter intestinalis TaxID=2419774 RepID=A0A387B6R8_9MICO|nr:winged helix DNA-binding domain-containing protein [Protaetiibacter intestinalis]AYF96895.1 winged helix DNA-binding domain-containing protein [Protaetiibacter intestinalis]
MLSPRGRRTVAGLRLAAQHIARTPTAGPAEVVRGLLAVQAQDYPGALWAVGLRSGATEAQVEAAHTSGAIVRSWPFRGTLHLVAAEDLGWMLSLTGERIARSAAGRVRQLGITEAELERVAAIARARLAGGGRADRSELLAAFRAGGVPTEGDRGIHLLGNLAHTGLVVLSGRTEYALLEEHVAEPRRLDPDAAADELALRYYAGHGPATVRDLAWWSGLPLTLVRAATERVRGRLAELEVDGVVHLMRPGLEPAAGGVRLLPGFDEYLLGYADRSAVLAPEYAGAVVPGGNGLFLPTIVSRGEIVGLWRRDLGRRTVRVELAPFAPLPATVRASAEAEARRYGRFLGRPVELGD